MRLAAKTGTYAVIHLFVATAVAYAFVGNFSTALGIGLVEPLIQTVVFAVHDFAWERDSHRPCEVTHADSRNMATI